MKVAPAAWIQRVTTLKNRTMITEATTEYIKGLEAKPLFIAKKPNEAETSTCISRDEHKIPIIPKCAAAGKAAIIKTHPPRKQICRTARKMYKKTALSTFVGWGERQQRRQLSTCQRRGVWYCRQEPIRARMSLRRLGWLDCR